jgi:hypothetical protein
MCSLYRGQHPKTYNSNDSWGGMCHYLELLWWNADWSQLSCKKLQRDSMIICHRTTLWMFVLSFTLWLLTVFTFQNTPGPQIDARGNSVNNVGGDQHYHFNFTFCQCPHARANAVYDRAETSVREFAWFFIRFHADSSLRTLAINPKDFRCLLKIEGRSSQWAFLPLLLKSSSGCPFGVV